MNKSMMQTTRQEGRSYDFQALFPANTQHDFQSSLHMGDFIDDSSLQSVVQKHTTCTQVPSMQSQGPQFPAKIGVMDISSYQSRVTKFDEDFGNSLPVISQAYIKSSEPEDHSRWNAYCKTSLPVSHSPEVTQRTDAGSSITCNRKISDNYVDPFASMAISAASDKESALMEPTDLSSAYGSLNNIKHGCVDGKRKRCDDSDGIDLESEDSHTDVGAPKKSHRMRSDRPKRTRAAETHNQSERRRRGKINEKLRALQDIIPNSNKTDKASLLTETIKYLRKLRWQLQILSHYPNGANQSEISELMLHGEVSHVDNRLDFGKQNIVLNSVLENFRNGVMPAVVGSSSPTIPAQIPPSSRSEIARASIEPPFVSSSHGLQLRPPHTLTSSQFGDLFHVN